MNDADARRLATMRQRFSELAHPDTAFLLRLLKEAEADAARYRGWREGRRANSCTIYYVSLDGDRLLSAAEFDAAIDAEIARKRGAEP